MNLLDLAIPVLALGSSVDAYWRGFSLGAFSFGGMVLGAAAGAAFSVVAFLLTVWFLGLVVIVRGPIPDLSRGIRQATRTSSRGGAGGDHAPVNTDRCAD